ncbi:MAG: L-threonylcarbamoyladenylate synthase [Desulfobacterales bacterium]|nr:L-threonylcarbamoyladenylate synthase [Desulfobacterales bacterium]
MIIKINPENPQLRLIRKVVDALKEGGVIAYPTDTIYGLGCDLYQKDAIERVHHLKKHSKHKRLSIICADLKDISNYAHVPDYAYRIMRSLIPGPYTFILEATKLVPKIMLTNQKTVGIRVPDNNISLALVKELEHPIITTSVIRPDESLYSDPEEIDQMFGKAVDLVIDGGTIVAAHSSIVDLTDDYPRVLRSGKGDVSFITA